MSTSALLGLESRVAQSDPLLVQATSSMLTMEARHDEILRQVNGLVPGPASFDASLSKIWAYNLAMLFVVPGLYPVGLPLPTFPSLTATLMNTTLASKVGFSWDPQQVPFQSGKPMFVVWVSQLDIPVYTNLEIHTPGNGTTQVPPTINSCSGTVFAAITSKRPRDVEDLALSTLAGPMILSLS